MFPRRPSSHRGWAHGPWGSDLVTQPCSWGALRRGVGLWAGLFLQALDDPHHAVCLLLFAAKEQYFIPGRRGGGEPRAGWERRWQWAVRGLGQQAEGPGRAWAGQACLEPAPGPSAPASAVALQAQRVTS